MSQAFLRVLIHEVLLHPILSELIPFLNLLPHGVVEIQMLLEACFRITIGLLSISVFELLYGVEGVDPLRVHDFIHALLRIAGVVSGTQVESGSSSSSVTLVVSLRSDSLIDIVATSRSV